jgi:inositol transporter-like SP family MFS transporter
MDHTEQVMDDTEQGREDQGLTDRAHWKNTILAGLANYIDAGSIVAGAAGLTLWTTMFHLSSSFVGLIGAISSNAISAGVGALVGGRLCDKFGRKKIYQWDMLLYAFGLLFIIFSSAPWMLLIGYVIAGLAVGADVPASWTLIAELAPDGARGKHSGVAQVLWYSGPVVVLLLSLALSPLGVLGVRIVFAQLLVVAICLWFARRSMKESAIWTAAERTVRDRATRATRAASRSQDTVVTSFGHVRELFNRRNVSAMAFLIGMYGVWNLWAGTNGFFLPFILRTVGSESQAMSVTIQCVSFVAGIVAIYFIFMRLVDRVDQKLLFGAGALLQVIGMLLLCLFRLTLPVALGYVLLSGLGGGFGQQSFFQLWSGELFPTLLRSTAQGLMFAVVRISLGFWSLFVPTLTKTGFSSLAWILTGFVAFSGLVGFLFAPRNEGKSLAQIQYERHGTVRAPRTAPVARTLTR